MSRILARVLGGPAGPDPILPRLPTRFEPGLEMTTAPEPLAYEPEAAGPEDLEPSGPAAGDRAVGTISAAGRLSARQEPTDPAAGPPAAGPSSPGVRPVPGDQPPSGSAPVLPAGSGGRPGAAGPARRRDEGPPRPDRPWPAYPVRPAAAIPELAEPPAPALGPPESAADRVAPVRPADQAPTAAVRPEPASPRRRPDPGAGPGWAAPRRAARPVQGQAEAEPAVHITIGQVEIRAAAGSRPPAARPAAKPRRVAPDLSEYLQRRGQRR